MKKTEFSLFDTAGNTTIFVSEPDALKKALSILPAEQAAWADLGSDHIQMAGDEFCVNACLAYAALKSMTGEPPHELKMAGEDVKLKVEGFLPNWQCTASVRPKNEPIFENAGYSIVKMPGISHALKFCNEFADDSLIMRQGLELIDHLSLSSEPAAGIVWWRKTRDCHEIKPLVTVPGAMTCNIEGACGSGSLALALALGQGEYKIRQPSGQFIEIIYSDAGLEISAPVKILANGALWLH